MKRTVLIALSAIVLLCSGTDASARGFVIKGGLNFPSLDLKNINSFDIKANTGWHAGVGYQTGSALGFSFQPELNFVRNSADITETANSSKKLMMNMIQLVPNVQWGIDLLICKPFLYVSPYVGLNMSYLNKDTMSELSKKLDYGIGLGAGINIWKFQVTGKYSWSFGNVISWSEYIGQVKDVKFSNGAFILSAAIIL